MNDFKKEIYSLNRLERKVLPLLLVLNSLENLVKLSNLSETECRMALALLESKKSCELDLKERKIVVLDNYGKQFLNEGLPEIQVLKALNGAAKLNSQIKISPQVLSSALGELRKNSLIEIEKVANGILIKPTKKAQVFLQNYKNPLELFKVKLRVINLTTNHKLILNQFKFRKGFFKEEIEKTLTFKLTEIGRKLASEIKKTYLKLDLVETLSSEMLKNGSWKKKEFRHYDLDVRTQVPQIGRRHPMFEANDILREVFIEMGFSEMKGPLVESAFWCMDTMWIPQDHPARDEQDTFYLEGKAKLPDNLLKKVKKMHEKGIKNTHTSLGDFSEEISSKTLLRTHSTSTTFRVLAELGEKFKNGEEINGKYFCVGPVFRNEAVDATHLAEFYQAEGFILGDDLSLADLMGFIKEYYAKLGIEKIRFKPTYNPYTEPSMEAHYYDSKLKKWYALINSGIFRAETLEPLGLSKKTILAWGMGASRVAALLSGKNSMRDITGATCDLEWLRTRAQMRRRIVR